MRPIKWYTIVEKSNNIDNYAIYVKAVKQPDISYRPVNKKYIKQKSRFIKLEI
jgi:hypothetical protein